MASGGEVKRYCANSRAHSRECEYFAGGGEVEIDPSQVEIDAEPTVDAPSDPTEVEVPADQVEMDDPAEPAEPVVPEVPADQVEVDAPIDTKDWSQGSGKIPEAARAQLDKDYEDAFEVGSMVTGGGAFAAGDKVAAAAAKWAGLGKVGSGFLKGAISNGIIAATDEASQMLLGENPEHPVANILASMGLGSVLSGAGAKTASVASQKLTKLTEGKLGDRVTSWLAGLGSASNRSNKEMAALASEMSKIEGFSKKDYESGIKAFKTLLGKVAAPASVGAATSYGYHEDGMRGALKYGTAAYGAGLGFGILGKLAGKVSTPVVLKILSSDSTLGMLDALSHAEKVAKGVEQVDRAVEGLFGGSAKAGAAAIDNRKKIEEWLEQGGVTDDVQQALHGSPTPETQGFAKGGEVKPVQSENGNGVAVHFPEQNMLMQAAKARASNYLNSLRPSKHQPKLAFDAAPDDRQQKKAYKRALDIAASPLSVLDKIRDGTVEPEQIKDLGAMFPEVVSLLQRKTTERISKDQVAGKKPSYKVRQGLSMLLGTPLSAELTPQNIQAAQAVFARSKQSSPQGAPSKPSGTKASLSKSDQAYLTDDQARISRQQRRP